METEAIEFWEGQNGRNYTQRNPKDADSLNSLYMQDYGMTRLQMNHRFLSDLPRRMRILEVGCNIGLQLQVLQGMGFKNLTGMDVVEFEHPSWDFKVGKAQAIPFGDASFDMVFTSGVLIHIAESELRLAMKEIYRVTRRWVWLFEYWNDERVMIPYQGQNDRLWADDFSFIMHKRFGLEYRDYTFYEYRHQEKYSEMALMEK